MRHKLVRPRDGRPTNFALEKVGNGSSRSDPLLSSLGYASLRRRPTVGFQFSPSSNFLSKNDIRFLGVNRIHADTATMSANDPEQTTSSAQTTSKARWRVHEEGLDLVPL
jgi:hypothetical protein